jgi:hypothetical protein
VTVVAVAGKRPTDASRWCALSIALTGGWIVLITIVFL